MARSQISADLFNNASPDEQARVIDVVGYGVMAVNAMMSVEYRLLNVREQWQKSKVVSRDIHSYIEAIGKSTPAHASLYMKKTALDSLLEIGKRIVSCDRPGDTFGFEVAGHFSFDYILEETMLQIVKNLTVEERTAACLEFSAKLLQLEKLGRNHYLYLSLSDVRRAMLGEKNVELNLDFSKQDLSDIPKTLTFL